MHHIYGSFMDPYVDPIWIPTYILYGSDMESYMDLYVFVQNVDISFEICVNVFQLIQNFNIQLEICVNGSVDTENCALA